MLSFGEPSFGLRDRSKKMHKRDIIYHWLTIREVSIMGLSYNIANADTVLSRNSHMSNVMNFLF